ncbi:MAG TPA: hypothetical protein VN238_15465 [Solirubrobacteraceae bacterium]|nr:hypothetical protein [Solirubrobacteraceae bacterium]
MRGTTEATAIQATPVFRGLMSLVAVFFTAGFVVGLVGYDHPWWLRVLVGVLAAVCVLGAAAAFTERTWVEADPVTGCRRIHARVLWRHDVLELVPGSSLALTSKGAALGSTVSGTWTLAVKTPDAPLARRFSTPWVPDIALLLAHLAPAVEADPALAADDRTREAVLAAARTHGAGPSA